MEGDCVANMVRLEWVSVVLVLVLVRDSDMEVCCGLTKSGLICFGLNIEVGEGPLLIAIDCIVWFDCGNWIRAKV